ncbi:MAG TPA: hypothetical protein VKW70_06145 [Terriglobia bacterium]|nr:hypothetical protein [Terriglobia bacterium]
MRIYGNRIVISLIFILGLSIYWEFYLRPVTGPLYRSAVEDYREHRYARSLEELQEADRFEPNDPSILALMGWDLLKLSKLPPAERYFRQACEFAPDNPDPLLGYIYVEIALEKRQEAERLLQAFVRKHGKTPDYKNAEKILREQTACAASDAQEATRP